MMTPPSAPGAEPDGRVAALPGDGGERAHRRAHDPGGPAGDPPALPPAGDLPGADEVTGEVAGEVAGEVPGDPAAVSPPPETSVASSAPRTTRPDDAADGGGWRRGMVIGIGLASGSTTLAVSFGAFAVLNGVPPWLAVVMSTVVFSGSAQFAFITAVSGGLLPALGAASLMNLRFIPMAATTAGALRGGWLRRTVEAQSVVDGSWAAAHRPDGTIDRELMLGATLVQWPTWVLGTALGAYLLPSVETVRTIGLDAIFPAFFGLLLLDIMRSPAAYRRLSAASACCTALALLVVPVGVAMLAAVLPALLAARAPSPDEPRLALGDTPDIPPAGPGVGGLGASAGHDSSHGGEARR